MVATPIALALSLLKKPLEDLYNLGKGKFETELNEWKNDAKAKQLARKVLVYDKIRTIWQKTKDVRISQIYYAPQIAFSDHVTRSVDSLAKIPLHQNFVIEGTVGQGKSVFLRYLCLQELKENSTGRIPVFIELRTIEKHLTLENAIKSGLDNLGFVINDDLYEFYLESGRIVLLLDGFDELPSKHILSVMEELESLSVKYLSLQIIVTSRPDRDIQKSSRFTVLKISPLKSKDFEPFLKKINVPATLRNQLLKALSSDASKIAELLTTPLMLTLAAFVYRAERDIPAELPQFFEILFQTVFTAHDKSKIAFTRECKSGLDDTSLQRLFETFCFMSLQAGNLRSLKNDSFESAYLKTSQFTKNNCKMSDFKHDIVQVACLMQVEGYDTTFIHQSVQEYYAASFIKHCIDEAAQKFYETVRKKKEYKWVQVLQFLKLIDEYRWAKYFRLPTIKSARDYLSQCTSWDRTKMLILKSEMQIKFDESKKIVDCGAFWVPDDPNDEIKLVSHRIIFKILEKMSENYDYICEVSKTHTIRSDHFSAEDIVLPGDILVTEPMKSSIASYLESSIEALSNEIGLLEEVVRLEESKINIF